MTRNWVVVAAVIFLVVAASSSEPVPPTASSTEEDAQSADAAVRIGNHLREGNDALASGDYRAAIRSYEACLALDPDERYCNINYASSLVDDVYRNNGSEEEEEEEKDGRDDVDEREDRMARAVSALRRVLRLHPRDGDAAFNLALLLQDTSKSEEVTRESAMLYQIAVQAMEGSDPDDGGGGGGGIDSGTRLRISPLRGRSWGNTSVRTGAFDATSDPSFCWRGSHRNTTTTST